MANKISQGNVVEGHIGIRVFIYDKLDADESKHRIKLAIEEWANNIPDASVGDYNVETSVAIKDRELIGIDFLFTTETEALSFISQLPERLKEKGYSVENSDVIVSAEKKQRQKNRPRLSANLALYEEDNPANTIPLTESMTLENLLKVSDELNKPIVLSAISRGVIGDAVQEKVEDLL